MNAFYAILDVYKRQLYGNLGDVGHLSYVSAFCGIPFYINVKSVRNSPLQMCIRYRDSTVPWWDSLTTSLSIIAMWMLAHKYVEQWLVWLVVDIVSCGIYIYKDLYFTSFLYGLYTVIAFFGYLKWKQLMNLSYERV